MTRKQTTKDYWLHHYQLFKSAGITQREYCRKNDLGYFSFNKWKRQFDKENTSTALQQLPIQYKPAQEERFEIVLQGNVRISIPNNFSEKTLSKIISAVRDQK